MKQRILGFIAWAMWVILIALITSNARAQEYDINNEVKCLADNIFEEAKNQKTEGMRAVGNVTVNRLAWGEFGGTICEVVYQRIRGSCAFTWTCSRTHQINSDDELKIYIVAHYLAEEFLEGKLHDNTDGALYYRRRDNHHPWFDKMIRLGQLVQTVTLKDHVFFKPAVSLSKIEAKVIWNY